MSERKALFEARLSDDERRWLWTMASWTNVSGRTIEAKYDRLGEALTAIYETARWYADNGVRDPHEVDHARFCVEILSLAQETLGV